MSEVTVDANMTSEEAFKKFQTDNDIQLLDEPYKFNAEVNTELRVAKPWRDDAKYFRHVQISTIALLKMITHARSGGEIEIMGMLQGQIKENTFIVSDVFALPVEGTETRVNAQTEAYEYMSKYAELYNKAGYKEQVVGWYHSHPGYGCWLSGIDVSTQALNQQFTEPFLAIVVDPTQTLSSGKVDLGAFRTFPEGESSNMTAAMPDKYIPMNKVDDYGHHSSRYYQLETSYYMSSMDTKLMKYFWNSYWVQAVSGNKLASITGYLSSQLKNIAKTCREVNRESKTGDLRATRMVTRAGEDSRKLIGEVTSGLLQEYFKRSFTDTKNGGGNPAV
uniref:COP9 signalosome complex subunit 5 n=1 Tax=Panagrellus redivivus TaxID=6233 RepID=A0A7E4UZR9_PANRE